MEGREVMRGQRGRLLMRRAAAWVSLKIHHDPADASKGQAGQAMRTCKNYILP